MPIESEQTLEELRNRMVHSKVWRRFRPDKVAVLSIFVILLRPALWQCGEKCFEKGSSAKIFFAGKVCECPELTDHPGPVSLFGGVKGWSWFALY